MLNIRDEYERLQFQRIYQDMIRQSQYDMFILMAIVEYVIIDIKILLLQWDVQFIDYQPCV